MKRILLSACMMVAQVYNISAQSARTTVEIDGQVQPAVSINVNEQEDFVKESLNNLLKNAGAKTDRNRHAIIAKHATIPGVSAEPVDLYIKLDSKGKGKNEVTTVWVTINKNPQTILTTDTSADAAYEKALAYVNTFPDKIAADRKEQQVKELTNKMDDASDDLKSAEKKKNKADKKLEKKQKELKKAQEELKKVDN